MNINTDSLRDQLALLKKPGLDAEAEASHIESLTQGEFRGLLSDYEYGRVINAGGSGIVIEVQDTQSRARRAMKISRITAPSPEEADPENPVSIDLELAAMSMVTHGSITQLFQGAKTSENHYCFISQLVDEPRELDQYTHYLIDDKYASLPSSSAIEATVIDLADKLLGLVDALRYMHSLHIYHMDIKPANLLVDAIGLPYVTDLGFARCRDRYASDELVPVGFTFGFEHKDLSRGETFRVKSTLGKARNLIKAGDLGPKFDMYSLAKTILFLLRIIEQKRARHTASSYSFSFLHLLATLMMDGENRPRSVQIEDTEEDGDYFLDEVALGIRENIVREHTLTDFAQVQERLIRLLGRCSLPQELPELDIWYPKSVNHGVGYLNMTPRIESIVDHPLFQRLRTIKHLGVVDGVYPGASHTRFAHSLGVCDMACRYLLSLYNDRENPIFTVLISHEELKIGILAALIHDLTHSDFGHEMEELHKTFSHDGLLNTMVTLLRSSWSVFNDLIDHEELGKTYAELGGTLKKAEENLKAGKISLSQVLRTIGWDLERLSNLDPSIEKRRTENQALLDDQGRTFLEIVEGCSDDEWGLRFSEILAVLGGGQKRAIYGLLNEVLDGVIDADKLDYLSRDSRACNVPYGDGVDIPRLLKCITLLKEELQVQRTEMKRMQKEIEMNKSWGLVMIGLLRGLEEKGELGMLLDVAKEQRVLTKLKSACEPNAKAEW